MRHQETKSSEAKLTKFIAVSNLQSVVETKGNEDSYLQEKGIFKSEMIKFFIVIVKISNFYTILSHITFLFPFPIVGAGESF